MTQIPEPSLVILDDKFPRLGGPFRIAEYNTYLEHFDLAQVKSTTGSFGNRTADDFQKDLNDYVAVYPQFKNRISRLDPRRRLRAKLAYVLFIQNAFFFLDMLEQNDVPLIFTLYQGGGFHLHHPVSDRQIQRVCSSRVLRKVIINSVVTEEYLLDKGFCPLDKIELVNGWPILSKRLTSQIVHRKHYREEKGTFDICFVAYKYTRGGVDKGYDVFIEVAKVLATISEDFSFHVVGNFDESDGDIKDLRGRITFYGRRPTDFFPEFYSRIDVILSPNIPFSPDAGSWDAFPTTSCVEAGICGVAVFCTDHLKQNMLFKDKEEIVVISRDVFEIVETIEDYRQHPTLLYELARKGQITFRKHFDIENSMAPRLRIISEQLFGT